MKSRRAIQKQDEGPVGHEPPGRPFAAMLAKRLCFFFLAMSLVALFFWITGNFRRFLDSTQAMLLASMRWSSLGLAMSASLGLGAMSVHRKAPRAGRRLPAVLGYLAILAFAALLMVFSEGLARLSAGLS